MCLYDTDLNQSDPETKPEASLGEFIIVSKQVVKKKNIYMLKKKLLHLQLEIKIKEWEEQGKKENQRDKH